MKIRSVIPSLIVVNIIFYLLQVLIPSLTTLLALSTTSVMQKPWTLLTALFLHALPGEGSGVMHIAFNMYTLFLFGPIVEREIGWKRFLGIYLISGILAGAGFVVWQELIVGSHAVVIGASGAIMAILGVTIVFFPDMPVLFFFIIPMSMRTAGIIFALIDLFGFVPGVAHAAHITGLLVGVAYGMYFKRTHKKLGGKFRQTFESKRIGKNRRISVMNKHSLEDMTDEEINEYLRTGRL